MTNKTSPFENGKSGNSMDTGNMYAENKDILSKCKGALLQLKSEKVELQAKISNLETKSETLGKTCIDLNNKIKEQETEFRNKVDNLVKTFEINIMSKDNDLKSLKFEIEKTKREKSDLEKRIESSDYVNKKAHKQLVKNDDEKVLLKNTLLESNDKLNSMKSENEFLLNRLESLEAALTNKEKQLGAYESSLRALENKLSNSVKEFSKQKCTNECLLKC